MLIATFNSTTGWVGKTISFEGNHFVLEAHGPITASDVLEYDRQGQLDWAYDGLGEWVASVAMQTQPAAAPLMGAAAWGGAAVAAPARRHNPLLIIGIVLGAILAIVVVAAAIGSVGSKGENAGSSSSTGDAPAVTQPTAPSGGGSNVGVVGDQCIYTDDSGARAVVTLISVTDSSQPKDASTGEAPQNGNFATCDVSIQVTAGSYDFNPLDFYYQAPDGRTYDAFEGNAIWAGFDPQLESGTLSAGQHTRGYVTFDVPIGTSGADIQLEDAGSNVVFQWTR